MIYFWVVLLASLIFSSGGQRNFSNDRRKEISQENRKVVPEPSFIGGLLVAGALFYSFKKRKH